MLKWCIVAVRNNTLVSRSKETVVFSSSAVPSPWMDARMAVLGPPWRFSRHPVGPFLCGRYRCNSFSRKGQGMALYKRTGQLQYCPAFFLKKKLLCDQYQPAITVELNPPPPPLLWFSASPYPASFVLFYLQMHLIFSLILASCISLLPFFKMPIFKILSFLFAGVMGCGAAEATDLGFVCFFFVNPRVLSANPSWFWAFCVINFPILPPPPVQRLTYRFEAPSGHVLVASWRQGYHHPWGCWAGHVKVGGNKLLYLKQFSFLKSFAPPPPLWPFSTLFIWGSQSFVLSSVVDSVYIFLHT